MSDINNRLKAFLKAQENADDNITASADLGTSTDAKVAECVVIALEKLGYSEDVLHAKLVKGEMDEEDDDDEDEEMEAKANFKAQVSAGLYKVLKALKVEGMDDDENEMEAMEEDGDKMEAMEEEEKDDLEAIADSVASFLQNHPSAVSAANLTSRLTASMNISVMAITQRSNV